MTPRPGGSDMEKLSCHLTPATPHLPKGSAEQREKLY